MVTDSGPLLAVLVFTGWCTLEEAEAIKPRLEGQEIPHSVRACIAQLEYERDKVRHGG